MLNMRVARGPLHREFGVRFRLLRHSEELHRTPFDTSQQFLYCFCRVE
jgi:hypothetical protein